jgi:hypothetical protein
MAHASPWVGYLILYNEWFLRRTEVVKCYSNQFLGAEVTFNALIVVQKSHTKAAFCHFSFFSDSSQLLKTFFLKYIIINTLIKNIGDIFCLLYNQTNCQGGNKHLYFAYNLKLAKVWYHKPLISMLPFVVSFPLKMLLNSASEQDSLTSLPASHHSSSTQKCIALKIII